MESGATKHRVVVVGGGFGGLQAVKAMGRLDAEITLVDRHNYHLFQPLSYQVATGALAPGDIAMPLRHVFRRQKQVEVLLAEVADFELKSRRVLLRADVPDGQLKRDYDTLIVSGGSAYSYFGHDEWREVALEVKSLDSALEVRGRILHAFEAAELDPAEQQSWLTFAVVGAGPTGVEMAGQIAELSRDTLSGEFEAIDPSRGRVILIETGDKVLATFPDPLPERALRSLERLGVDVMLGHTVIDVRDDLVRLAASDGSQSDLATRTVIWAAGVRASPLAELLGQACGAEVDRNGRLTVEPDLSLPGHPEVLALGDMVKVRDAETGEPRTFPGLAPVAMQEGRYAARVVSRRIAGKSAPAPFHYRDKGTLATIGRDRGVADIKGLRFNGFMAWATWLLVHIYYLIGFENRIVVLFRWAFAYITRGRGNRLITAAADLSGPPELPAPPHPPAPPHLPGPAGAQDS